MDILLAQASLAELTADPLLSVAAMLLIAVSVAYIVMSRLITKEIRKQALRRMRARSPKKPPPRPPKDKDLWSYPP